MDADCLLGDDRPRRADLTLWQAHSRLWRLARRAAEPGGCRCAAENPRHGSKVAVPAVSIDPNDAGLLRAPGGNLSRRRCVRGVTLEPCREGAMTAWHVRARSRRAGALLGAVAVLVAGCTAPGGGSGPRADRAGAARHSAAAGSPGRVFGHRIAGTPGPVGVKHGSKPGIAGPLSLVQCAPPLGDPVVNRAEAASRPRVAVPACLCCRWCACAWVCCGCGPARWPPRSHLAWPCCPRWLGPPDWDSSPIRPACGPGCASHACPVGPDRSAAGSVQARSPGSAAAGAS
jgi:hypothetical protein